MRKTKHRATNEVHLRQLTIDEALLKLDQYLHDAFMAGLNQVRVVHGKGTGTLRRAVREELARHPLVQSYRPGGYREGGEGVTIVTLAPR
jgi:DNA mismatch repair protein MutS2